MKYLDRILKKGGWEEVEIVGDFVKDFRRDLEDATRDSYGEFYVARRECWAKARYLVLD